MANDPYRVVSKRTVSNRELWDNFVIRVHGRDSLEKRSEWTESGRGLFNIIGNDRSLDRCIFMASS